MERNTFLGVLLVTLLALGIGLLIPMKQDDNHPALLPWTIKVNNDGSSTVFGLTLGRSTMGEAERQFQEKAELTLFRSTKGRLSAEGYFDDVLMSGLAARIVLVAGLSDAELHTIYNRGLRIATMGDGQRKITMRPEDIAKVRATPIASITYMPKTAITWSTIAKHFGKPARKIMEPDGTTEHWLYPAEGLDIAMDASSGKAIMQYVAPRDFQQVMAPLIKKAATAPGKANTKR